NDVYGPGAASVQSLRCNGESDCDDFSDEEGCQTFNLRDDKCSTLMPIPGAGRGTQGYNILTQDFVDHVLDPKYFGGQCEYVYNGEWRKIHLRCFCENLHYNEDDKNYRKPYNYHTYHFVAQARSEGSRQYYEDMVSLLNARKTTSSHNGGASVGVYYVEVGLSGSKEAEFLKNLTQHKSQDLGFIRLWSKVQTAVFKMRTNKLMLHEDFYYSLMDTFGTHYVTEGTMGGTLEYVAVVNKTSMTDAEQVGRCIGGSIGFSAPLDIYGTLGFKLKGKSCDKTGKFSAGKQRQGVVTDSGTGLLAIRNPETYRKWGHPLQYNPELIRIELCALSTAADHLVVRAVNLERALDEYCSSFDPCRCAPCRHNGIPVLSGTSCGCICRSGYQGEACEETLRRGELCLKCWKSTTTKKKRGILTRSRSSACLGSTSQTQRC
uniref:Complement C8 alpha chain n=1 Tax=Salarias fasciatus TaxID=181472 RepID=A0A672H8H9_SALFA